MSKTETKQFTIFDCGICSCYHPWDFDGDCRDNHHRYNSPEDYIYRNHFTRTEAEKLEVRTMSERVAADNGEEYHDPDTGYDFDASELANLPDDKIDTSDIPVITDWNNAVRGKYYRPKKD